MNNDKKQSNQITYASTLLIGIGNELRNDDGVGIMIAEKIGRKRIRGVHIEKASGEGTSLMETWKGFNNVIIVDAVSSDSAPGEIHRIKVDNESVPAKILRSSTHSFGLAEAIEISRSMNCLPPNLQIFGIEGENFESGFGISEPVKNSAGRVSEEIVKYIESINNLNLYEKNR
jgi:hydrogenase maturation protease